MTFTLKVTGQSGDGELYARVDGLSQANAELVVTIARGLAKWSLAINAAETAMHPTRRDLDRMEGP